MCGTIANCDDYDDIHLSSRALSAAAFAEAVRGHWGIENNLYWILDVTFNEDQSPTRVAISATVNPIVSAIFGVYVPNELIIMNMIVGLVLVAVGIALATSNR